MKKGKRRGRSLETKKRRPTSHVCCLSLECGKGSRSVRQRPCNFNVSTSIFSLCLFFPKLRTKTKQRKRAFCYLRVTWRFRLAIACHLFVKKKISIDKGIEKGRGKNNIKKQQHQLFLKTLSFSKSNQLLIYIWNRLLTCTGEQKNKKKTTLLTGTLFSVFFFPSFLEKSLCLLFVLLVTTPRAFFWQSRLE